MLSNIIRSHAREHKARRLRRVTNLNDVLTFMVNASGRELRSIEIALNQIPNWRSRKGGQNE